MNWWGKILGGAFGMMIGGPIGALLGAALGHEFDKGLDVNTRSDGFGNQERLQTLFYTTTFSVMGHVCKADGRISEDEIALARQVMQQMDMDEEQQSAAIRLFNQGKKAGFPLNDVMQQFKREIGFQPNLIRMFIEVQIMAAFADGVLHKGEREVLMTLCRILNVLEHEFEHLCAMIGGMHAESTSKLDLGQAYAILDVPESASTAEIKRAYRRMISRHHPDKLVAKGLPEEMMKVAAERTHEIKQAYETIKEAKGF